MNLVDLSHPFDPAAKTPGSRMQAELKVRPVKTLTEDGVNSLEITFGNHIGTHVDAPRHLIHGGESLDELPLDVFYGSAVVLDIPKGPNGGVDVADLSSAEPAVETGDIVLIRTGWGLRFTEHTYGSHHPYLTEEGAHWLVARGVRMVGMDVQSVDLPHSLRQQGFGYTSLRVLLDNRIPAILNLTNLDEISGKRVMLFAVPINFRGADGAPARVVALCD